MKLKCTHQFFSQIWINITKSFFKLSLYCEFPKSLYWNYTKPILSQFHFLESSFLEYKGWVFTPIKRYQYIINFTKAKNILLFGKMVTKRQLWILTRSLCVSNTFKIEYMNKFMVKRLLLLDHLRVISFRFTSMDFSWNQVMDLLATTIGINHVFIMLHVSMEQVTVGTRITDRVAAIIHMTHWERGLHVKWKWFSNMPQIRHFFVTYMLPSI